MHLRSFSGDYTPEPFRAVTHDMGTISTPLNTHFNNWWRSLYIISLHLAKGQLLNLTKSEAIATGTRRQLAKFTKAMDVTVAGKSILFSNTLQIVEVTLDEKLAFDNHIGNVVRSYNYHTRVLRHIRPFIFTDTANTIPCSIIRFTA